MALANQYQALRSKPLRSNANARYWAVQATINLSGQPHRQLIRLIERQPAFFVRMKSTVSL